MLRQLIDHYIGDTDRDCIILMLHKRHAAPVFTLLTNCNKNKLPSSLPSNYSPSKGTNCHCLGIVEARKYRPSPIPTSKCNAIYYPSSPPVRQYILTHSYSRLLLCSCSYVPLLWPMTWNSDAFTFVSAQISSVMKSWHRSLTLLCR